jgi:subtilase family serine protease
LNFPLGGLVTRALKFAAVVLVALATLPAFTQNSVANPHIARAAAGPRGTIVIPKSSQATAADLGVRAHGNVRYLIPEQASPTEAPPFPGYGYETPASLACLYHVVAPIPGCNPNETTNTPSGGSGAIALVDAFDYPTAAADLEYFSAQFGLPFSSGGFQVVYAQGSVPPVDPTGSWELEEALDIEYSHAMAPNAKLYLVEANSNAFSDLFQAVIVAGNLVNCGRTTSCPAHSRRTGEVSMSWGGSEFATETEYDSLFQAPGVVYVGSAGDDPGVLYPCVSPNVVCAGGTSVARSPVNGNLIAEIAWSDAGGGISAYEPSPGYQATDPQVAYQLDGARGVPDISADANPNTGAWLWTSYPLGGETGWFIVGGTSLAAPALAGIINASGNFARSSSAELYNLYSLNPHFAFNDITYGACGFYSGTFSAQGWDLGTGFGSPRNLSGR